VFNYVYNVHDQFITIRENTFRPILAHV